MRLTITKFTTYLLLSFLFFGFTLCKKDESTTQKENVTISKWEYCQGCKETVQLFATVSSDTLMSMQKTGVEAHQTVEANKLATEICYNKNFNKQFQKSIKYSCIKILNDHSQTFLQSFTGSATASSILNKADLFLKKKQVFYLN